MSDPTEDLERKAGESNEDALRRELRNSLVTAAAIIAKHGTVVPGHPERRVVTLTDADLEAADGSTVFRVEHGDGSGTVFGVVVADDGCTCLVRGVPGTHWCARHNPHAPRERRSAWLE